MTNLQILLIAIAVFGISFLVSLIISKFIATGYGENIRTPEEIENSDGIFWILVLITVPILVIIVAHLSGE